MSAKKSPGKKNNPKKSSAVSRKAPSQKKKAVAKSLKTPISKSRAPIAAKGSTCDPNAPVVHAESVIPEALNINVGTAVRMTYGMAIEMLTKVTLIEQRLNVLEEGLLSGQP